MNYSPACAQRYRHILLAALLLLGMAAATQPAAAQNRPLLDGLAIWSTGAASSGSVALFRHQFRLNTAATTVQLAIFADTRYEAWIDGSFLGRGPARFSKARQEFDLLVVPDLAPGIHQLAVLVQHAPNARRSEPMRAGLQASLSALVGTTQTQLAASGPSWQAMSSEAWNRNARPVSDLVLIGPTELLDLRRLPAGWQDLAFDDDAWPQAQALNPPPFTALTPRTIPLLAQTPHAPTALLDAGLLSPGMQLLDLEPTGAPAMVTLRASRATTLHIEALEQGRLRLDGTVLAGWQPLGEPRRPDLLVLDQPLAAGRHRIEIDVGAAGRALLLGGNGITIEQAPPLLQGRDAGRRTLLANPTPGTNLAPRVTLGPDGATVEVPAAPYPRYLALDFGRILHGRVTLQAEGAAGTVLDIGLDERLLQGRVLPAPGSLHDGLWRQVDSWVLDGTPRSLSTIDARTGRYLLLQVFGPGPLTLRGLQVVAEQYPVTPVGSFASSDPQLDTIWQVGADSVALNMTDAYADPWRERGQWWGDAMGSYWVNKVTFGDYALLRRGLRQMADAVDSNGRPPAFAPPGGDRTLLLDYGMLWIEGLHEYWRDTGDVDLVRELYPAAQRLAGFLQGYENKYGLLTFSPEARWYESALVDWGAGPARRGESTAINAQYAATLGLLADLADAAGQPGGPELRQRSTQVAAAINARLYDEASGGYVSSILAGTVLPPKPQAQAWALRYGVVPAERRGPVAAALLRQLRPFTQPQGPTVEVYGMHWLLPAMGDAGLTNDAQRLIGEQYGQMLDKGATSWWEGFTSNQSYKASLSHGWGAAPTAFLSTHVLGAQTQGPQRWLVAPHPGQLRWAKGTIPTPAGPLAVSWNIPTCGQFALTLQAPTESSGTLLLAAEAAAGKVYLDGRLVWNDGPLATQATRTARGIELALSGGSHAASYAVTCQESYLPTIVR